jgi:ectoine hydroxylase-related dioxygenase (phytanoyl-CoA dioxygenase family)
MTEPGRTLLDERQRSFWNDNGFLVIPEFFDEHEVDVITGALQRTWSDTDHGVVVDDLVTNRRLRASDVDEADRSHAFKVNDLYLAFDDVRRVCLSERVASIVGELLADEPVLVNTLNLERGSQQADHVDSLFMTPATPGGLAATWMALEDVVDDAGPLRYYPESHRIEQYRFTDGGYHARDDEMPHWAEHMATEVERRGLEETRFLARKGDLFVWHAHLLHGGSEICNPALTRNSLVSHFFTRTDAKRLDLSLRPLEHGGYWFERPHQPVPAAHAAPDRATTGEPPVLEAPSSKRSLWDRLRRVRATDD